MVSAQRALSFERDDTLLNNAGCSAARNLARICAINDAP
ncbi:hypothetical protein ACV4W4_33150 [Pseudomonas aeruginosa]